MSETESHSPRPLQSQIPPSHIETRISYNPNEPEPLLSLLTSTHPLVGPVVNSSLSVYKTAQSYIPGAEWTERYVGLPLARTAGRVTGVEGGLRWALQRKDTPDQLTTPNPTHVSDVEQGFADGSQHRHSRHSPELSFENLPAYNPGDRSPPYTEQQVVLQTRERQQPPGWRQQLIISTSGLGVAMSEESLRSLRYCLRWLRWANDRLGGAVQTLRDLLQQWDDGTTIQEQQQQQPMSVAAMTQSTDESRQAALSQKIARLKTDVLQTLQQVVAVVSNYAGGALPENARRLVHRHLTSLPQRFSIATAMSSNINANHGDDAASSAQRVMVLAQEGLDMMTQVSGVVNDTLVSAEGWFEKLGRRRREGADQPPQSFQLQNGEKGFDRRDRSATLGAALDTDVKMEM